MDKANWERIRDVLITTICIGVLLWAGWSLMGQFIHVIVLLLLAMAVAFLVTPAVNLLDRYKYMPRVLSALIVYVIILAVLCFLVYALVFSVINQAQKFSDTVSTYVTIDLPKRASDFQKFLLDQHVPDSNINTAINQIQQYATNFAQLLASNVVNIVLAVTDALVNILLVVVLSFYLTLDGKRIRDSLFSIAPRRSKPHLLVFEDALNRVVGNYIRGQLTLAVLIGIFAGVGCAFLGLGDYALVIGVLAFLFETIPMVGPALASIPAILLSLLLPDPFPRTFWIAIYFVVVQIFESNILGPRIVGHAVGLHPVASIIALLIGAQLFGPFGALLATPIVAAGWVVIASFYRSLRGETAEQILAKKPTSPWVFRRPTKQLPQDQNGSRVGENLEQQQTSAVAIRGTPIASMDHIDLLRPIPDNEEQRRMEIDEQEE
jgi:predicted PurR-regulated permease PerM